MNVSPGCPGRSRARGPQGAPSPPSRGPYIIVCYVYYLSYVNIIQHVIYIILDLLQHRIAYNIILCYSTLYHITLVSMWMCIYNTLIVFSPPAHRNGPVPEAHPEKGGRSPRVPSERQDRMFAICFLLEIPLRGSPFQM